MARADAMWGALSIRDISPMISPRPRTANTRSGFAENIHFAGNDQVGHIAGIAFLENQLSADDRFAFPCLIVLVQ
jgi:hypothetical protein